MYIHDKTILFYIFIYRKYIITTTKLHCFIYLFINSIPRSYNKHTKKLERKENKSASSLGSTIPSIPQNLNKEDSQFYIHDSKYISKLPYAQPSSPSRDPLNFSYNYRKKKKKTPFPSTLGKRHRLSFIIQVFDSHRRPINNRNNNHHST